MKRFKVVTSVTGLEEGAVHTQEEIEAQKHLGGVERLLRLKSIEEVAEPAPVIVDESEDNSPAKSKSGKSGK